MRRFALLLLFTSCSFLSVQICSAQSISPEEHSGTSSPSRDSDQTPAESSRAITGVVLDPSGAGVPGAPLTLTSTDGTVIGNTATDSTGSFRFEKLALGVYTIEVQAAGFRETKLDVAVGKKPVSSVRINLVIASQNESVTVGAQDSSPQIGTEASENQNSNTIDRNALDRVPVFDQDYIATVSRFLDDNSTGTNGVTLVVNGVEANGPGVTPSAVQEVKINQNPYSALFSRPGRARLEIVTKGGTPELHGTVNFLFRDSVFDARNIFATQKPPEQRQYYEGSLTGPVGHSKKTT